ncbi:MAG: hypothetical protein PHV11_05550 [Candidatus Bipolaricaulis sp.]|nr:hypothetical protein [Candidatus Bipolaricaulis sp.]
MTEAIIAFLLVFIAVQEYFNRQERKKLIDAYLAKNLTELKQAERIEKEKPGGITEVPPDFIPFEEATDEQFDLAIKRELGEETEADKFKEKFVKRRANG